jgi:hypothetical protein
MNRQRWILSLVVVAVAGLAVLLFVILRADGDETSASPPPESDSYQPEIDPAEFTIEIDNPFLPLPVGSRRVYEAETEDGLERIVVEVTSETREVMGVDTVVVRDTVTLEDELIEDTYDWFAQDAEGNVWYFGEESTDFENGEPVSTEGSWEAGVDGAQPGIVMPAEPEVGVEYRQEYYLGEAEDMGEVLSLDEQVEVAIGSFDGVLQTKDWTPLEPDVVENKYYARGIGVVLELLVEGGEERVELVEMMGLDE